MEPKQIRFTDIIDRHKGKTAIVCGLGPSLKKHLEWIEHIDKEKYVVFCCNLYYKMTKIDADYWLIANPQEEMQMNVLYEDISAYKGVYLYADCIDKNDPKELLTGVTFIKMNSEKKAIWEYLQDYCMASEPAYKAVDTVVVHLIALGILTGCKEVLVSGVDLDYRDGYVKEGFNAHVQLGATIMPAKQDDSIKMIKKLKVQAAGIGVNVYCLPDGTKLAGEIGIKEIKI